MKTVEISTAFRPLAEYANDLGDDFVVLTSNNKPVAAIVSLKNVDPESLALSTNAEFLEIIEQARRECASGHTMSLSAMKKELGV
jgi:PHD/YefM family antitoxin component YafN of YafNO toxin-antitoxin module